jgi:hypothetical protein
MLDTNRVKHQIPCFHWRGGFEKIIIQENDRCVDLYKTGYVQEPQKQNDGTGKMIYPGTKD